MDTTAIQVLQRESGYLRLRLPPALRNPAAGTAIENGLRSLAGVLRVTLLTTEGRLAVRFDPHVCTAAAVALRLKSALPDLPELPATAAPEPATDAIEPAAGTDAGEQLARLRDKLTQVVPQRFLPMVESALTEKAVTNFFNDIVAFYLIRTHWDLITKYWLKDPVKYGNAWLTVFYLVFLLVRYRKS
jgi:hypothetical protein